MVSIGFPPGSARVATVPACCFEYPGTADLVSTFLTISSCFPEAISEGLQLALIALLHSTCIAFSNDVLRSSGLI